MAGGSRAPKGRGWNHVSLFGRRWSLVEGPSLRYPTKPIKGETQAVEEC
jgi:hypothetical protein